MTPIPPRDRAPTDWFPRSAIAGSKLGDYVHVRLRSGTPGQLRSKLSDPDGNIRGALTPAAPPYARVAQSRAVPEAFAHHVEADVDRPARRPRRRWSAGSVITAAPQPGAGRASGRGVVLAARAEFRRGQDWMPSRSVSRPAPSGGFCAATECPCGCWTRSPAR